MYRMIAVGLILAVPFPSAAQCGRGGRCYSSSYCSPPVVVREVVREPVVFREAPIIVRQDLLAEALLLGGGFGGPTTFAGFGGGFDSGGLGSLGGLSRLGLGGSQGAGLGGLAGGGISSQGFRGSGGLGDPGFSNGQGNGAGGLTDATDPRLTAQQRQFLAQLRQRQAGYGAAGAQDGHQGGQVGGGGDPGIAMLKQRIQGNIQTMKEARADLETIKKELGDLHKALSGDEERNSNIPGAPPATLPKDDARNHQKDKGMLLSQKGAKR
jgi:hypothetical protein